MPIATVDSRRPRHAPSQRALVGSATRKKARTVAGFRMLWRALEFTNPAVSACDMRQRRELGKRRRSETRIMLPLSRSSPCPLIRYAWKRGLEELPVNHVEDEGQHGRTPLIDRGSMGGLLFQDVFVSTPKWFRGGGPAHISTSRRSRG
jgi:hypothetical protein